MQSVVAKFDQLHDHSSLHQEDCIALIIGIVKEFRKTNIVIDALDELEDGEIQADLLAALKQVVDRSESALVKIFISSRDHVGITTIMDMTWNTRKEIIIGENNHEDIERFIATRVQLLDNPPSRSIPDSVKRDVELVLKERANGMFLWVTLSLDYLRKLKVKNPDTFVDKLNSAPLNIQELYSEILSTMSKHQGSEESDMIQRILTFLVYGRNIETYKSRAFLTAINHNPDRIDSKLSAQDVLDLCSSFVELDTRTDNFRLIHFSVKEFLQTRPEYQSEAAHSLLAIQCLTYIQKGNFAIDFFGTRFGSIRNDLRFFSYYASAAWIFHCAGAGPLRLNPPLADILQVFWWGDHATSTIPTFDQWVETFTKSFEHANQFLRPIIRGGFGSLRVHSRPTPFFLACQYGLQEVIEVLLDKGWDINQPIGNGSGLSLACSKGYFKLASYLIDHGATVAIDPAKWIEDLDDPWHRYPAIEEPLVDTMKSGDSRILELLLSQKEAMPLQAAMESALKERNANQPMSNISSSEARPMKSWDRQIDIMLAHFPDFEYSAEVQKNMFLGGPKLTEKLLARNRSLHVTDNTLEHLFRYVTSAQNAKDIIQCLLPLPGFVASKTSINFLKFYSQGEEDSLELMEYTLNLNRSGPAMSTLEEALRAAITNKWRHTLFTKALLRSNKSFKVSDDLILWTLRNSEEPGLVIDLLLQHDPTPRNISQSELKGLLAPRDDVSRIMARLVSCSPDLEVDEEFFIMAVDHSNSTHEDLELLLSRAPNVVLSKKLIKATHFIESDWAVSQVAASTQPQEITDDVLRAAVKQYNQKYQAGGLSQTIKEVIRKAPNDLTLSEKTYRAAFYSDPWVCQQVLQRWPSERAITPGLQSTSGFQLLKEAMPSIEISSASMLSFCQEINHESAVETLEDILAFQPHTVITEDMLLAVAERSDYDGTQIELLQALLEHDPHVDLTKRVIDRAVMSKMNAIGMLEVILDEKPHLEFSPLSLSMCKHRIYGNFNKYEETLNRALERSRGYRLDEKEMLDMMAICTSDALGVILAARQDAVVTERVIEKLVNDRTDNWERGYRSGLFEMLMNRAGISEAEHEAWTLRWDSLLESSKSQSMSIGSSESQSISSSS
ncbi:unnamed protein product [Penicillium salamii]|nr:unnamed protein product [Penicillium salamii]CAG8367507.1 unnamed protein product [Penicillium salamii]